MTHRSATRPSSGRPYATTPRLGPTILAWGLAVGIAFVLIAVTHFTSRDHDSGLHAGIAARLSQLPVRQWIAPEWWGFWTLQGPYCEHPAGIFILPAALARLGYPPLQAAYAVNAVYQAATFVLLTLIAASVIPGREARALGWLAQLILIAFVYRIRANHEYAVLAALLLAVYSAERARTRPAWVLGMAAGFLAVLLTKGVFAVIVPVVCSVWIVARASGWRDVLRVRAAWVGVAVMPALGVLATWGYEAAYVSVTGRSFLQTYQRNQLPAEAITGGSIAWRMAYSAVWYLARVVWYSLPWGILAGSMIYRGGRQAGLLPWSLGEPEQGDEALRHRQGAWFAMAASALLIAIFSLAHRKADRYIFPVYFLVGSVGAVYAVRRFPWLGRLVDRLDRPWVPAVFAVVLMILTLLTAGALPRFTFWRS